MSGLGESQPRALESDPFQVRDDPQGVIYATRDAVRRVASNAHLRARELKRGAARRVHRHPLGSVMIAAAAGMVLGGLIVLAISESLFSRR
jgi:ElaB/YqjD/DUF883 family membrane-anchored ribosome-binding protein